jgi:hypothetical protein
MPISINGTGTITGISAGGLPDDCITTADIAGSAVTTAKVNNEAISFAKLLSTDWTSLQAAGNGTAGYQKLPSGLIIQWGSANATTAGASVTFAIAFPTYAYAVVATNNNQTNPPAPSIGSLSTTGFVATVSAGGPNFYYIAIGK